MGLDSSTDVESSRDKDFELVPETKSETESECGADSLSSPEGGWNLHSLAVSSSLSVDELGLYHPHDAITS